MSYPFDLAYRARRLDEARSALTEKDFLEETSAAKEFKRRADYVVDALFHTGIGRNADGFQVEVIDVIDFSDAYVRIDAAISRGNSLDAELHKIWEDASDRVVPDSFFRK